MLRVQVKITGVKEVQDVLNSLPDAVRQDAIGNVLFEAAKPIADAARANAPVRTGKLRNSIKISLRARGMGEWVRAHRGAGIFVGATAPHAHFSEFGTARQPAQGWFRRAFDSAAETARRRIENGLLDAVLKAVRKAAQRNAKR
jgi:HK97 gp10 family phage protein